MAGVSAFREAFTVTDTQNPAPFGSYEARLARYRLFWAFFENNAYSNVHVWADSFKSIHGLYEYTRGVYNPSHRTCLWWRNHLMGGSLDPEAGNDFKTGALPIVTDNESLRKAIARLWRDSNWPNRKDVYTLDGTVMGDVGLRIIDDPEHERVYLDVLTADKIKSLAMDSRGFVKGYVLEEIRNDPRAEDDPKNVNPRSRATVTYNEVVTRDGPNVVYETFLDGNRYAWPEHVNRDGKRVDGWEEPYGFVPLVMVKHFDVGLDWGQSELHASLPTVWEVDDLGSKLNDQIRKTVDAKWAFLGVAKPRVTPSVLGRDKTAENDQPGRDEEGAIWLEAPGADVKAMVAPLDIAAVSAHILTVLDGYKNEHPEIDPALYAPADGNISGYAIRLRRQPVEEKTYDYRRNYDSGLTQAQGMAVAIGGWRRYKGYEGFDLNSFERGLLTHSIGSRPVFRPDPQELLELQNAEYTVLGLAESAHVPFEIAAKKAGWSDEQITEAIAARAAQPAAITPGGNGANGLGGMQATIEQHLADLRAAING